MRKFCSIFLYVVCLVLLSSCGKHANNLFGNIPSNYDNEMIAVTKKARQMTQNPAQLREYIKQMADSAFNVASEKSQADVDRLKGQDVHFTIDPDLDLKISSEIKIESVVLPSLNHTSTCINVSFDVATMDKQLSYILEDDSTMVGYGTYELPYGKNNGEKQHIEMEINAPNVPAKYQEKCKTIHFVTSERLNKELYTIQPNQIQWQKEYMDQLK